MARDVASSGDERAQSHKRRASQSQRPRPERHSSQHQRPTSERPPPRRLSSRRHSSQRASVIDEPLTAPAPARAGSNGREKPPTRPALQRRQTTARTRYIDMLLGLDHVSPLHNILASACVWILLAGYIVFPATFKSLQKSSFDDKADTKLKAEALATARNLPLLYVAAVACGVGVLGSLWLWWKHRQNYVWVVNRIFLPSLLNSVAGLVSTLVNVYSAQDGMYLSSGN